MKKIVLIFFLCASFFTAQSQGAAAASRQFKDAFVWQYRDSINTFESVTLDTNQIYALTRWWKDMQGHANYAYTTYNVSNAFYLIYPFVGATAALHKYEFYFRILMANNSETKLNFFGSPTHNANGLTTNGTTQYASIGDISLTGASPGIGTPRRILETFYGKSSTDTVSNTGMNFDVFGKNTTDNVMVTSYKNSDYPNSFLSVNNLQTFGNANMAIYDDATNEGRLSVSSSNGSGLTSSNRGGLVNQFWIRGGLVANYTNGSYNFGLARNYTSNVEYLTLQKLGSNANFYAGTIQFFSIRNRQFTSDEMIFFNNSVTTMQQRLGRY